MYRDLHKAGLRVFGLYGFTGTTCDCGIEGCTDAGKHPMTKGYINASVWSEEQLQTFEDLGHFDSGYGVVCKGLLVVDIDPRNGGDMSFLDQFECGFVVSTGGGGLHGYFTVPDGVSLAGKLDDHPGIDFKSSGYVVGPGSRHVKGMYTVKSGLPQEIGPAPDELLALLKRDEFTRVEIDGQYQDYSQADIEEMLSYVSNDIEYEDYIRIGMAIQHAGAPFETWDNWAQRSDKYTGRSIRKRWDSFGRSTNPVTLGTLLHHARAGGYEESVTFTPSVWYEPPSVDLDEPVDLLRPPGFVGEVAAWIESNNRRPRENLAVAAALNAVGNVIGLKYTDDKDGVSSNMFLCCVAGAGTGKEAPQGCITDIMSAAGIVKAKSGNIKSEQEIYRNLTLRSQACFLVIDELGFLLKKISNAGKSGASYLEGLTGILMSVQGKSNGVLSMSGDMYSDLMAEFHKQLAAESAAKADNERYSQVKIDNLQQLILDLEQLGGIKNPFLSLIGFTTRTNFDESVNYESATNGFLRRSFVIIEGDDAPPMKKDFQRTPLPDEMAYFIKSLYQLGETFDPSERLQYNGNKKVIPTTPDAVMLLDKARDELDTLAAETLDGMEALFLGAYENVSRVSLILAAPGGLRTPEHVRWAYALALRDIRFKRSLIKSNDGDDHNKGNAIVERIRHYLEIAGDDGLSEGVIFNKMKKHKRDNVDAALKFLLEQGAVKKKKVKPKRGPSGVRYCL